MKKPISRIATIHDLCGVGKAALTNVIPVLRNIHWIFRVTRKCKSYIKIFKK